MTRISMALGVAALGAVTIAVGCGGGSQQTASESAPPASTPAAPAQTGTEVVDITLKTDPDPVRTGENTFEVMVMQDGTPVTDAMVTTEFFMAAMPAMNMPEMRTKTELTHQGNGIYRGKGQVMMAGNWDVTVMVMRGGQEIGSEKLTLTAK
ncbi:MAG: FixH family protein [Acidobacteria bacterium]|nr:FixH family protein [Acidobacteriota bacterium]